MTTISHDQSKFWCKEIDDLDDEKVVSEQIGSDKKAQENVLIMLKDGLELELIAKYSSLNLDKVIALKRKYGL